MKKVTSFKSTTGFSLALKSVRLKGTSQFKGKFEGNLFGWLFNFFPQVEKGKVYTVYTGIAAIQ